MRKRGRKWTARLKNKPKVPEKRVPVDPHIVAKVYASLNNPPPQK